MKHPQYRQPSRREWRVTALSAAVLFGLTAISSSAHSATDGKQIGDLEIYQAAEDGKVTITMMLDTSGSMTAAQVGADACDLPSGVALYYYNPIRDRNSNTSPNYDRRYCLTTTGQAYYDRLTRLKDAIFELMDTDALDSEKVSIGIGQFSSQSNSDNNYTGPDGSSGKILVPAALLDESQRQKIKVAVAKLVGGNGTPTANAYAEAGAYMLGTNTSGSITAPREEYLSVGGTYYRCTSHTGTGCTSVTFSGYSLPWGHSSVSCQFYSGRTCWSKNVTQSANAWGFSGFNKSIQAAKSRNDYISPITSSSSCDGRGIYFLTDGVPNSSPASASMMASALDRASFSASGNGLPNGSSFGNGMPEVGAFAKALRDPTQNPLGQSGTILTAVVGFGSDLAVGDDISTNLDFTNAQGEQDSGVFYDCDSISDIDAKNACNWGAKSHPDLPGVGGFGEGGFYSAQSTEDIVKSITSFAADLNQTIPSAPSGTITVPENPYQAAAQLAYAYLPMLAPEVGENKSIWQGNLKKYNLDQGTLFGNSNEPLYDSAAGDLRSTTQDVWQTADFTENGETANSSIRAGGVYAQLRTPTSGRENLRKIYVEDYTSSSNKQPILRELGVSSEGRPVGFDQLVDTATYTTQNQLRLLNFLGFDTADHDNAEINLVTMSERASPDVNINDLTLVQPSQSIKVLGGVLHSTPAAISYGAALDDNGRITDDREDYVLFGSMDGALHLVDSDDGKEAVAVIPRSMMINQPEALVSGSTKSAIGQPYFGVDAPWLVATDYKYDLENDKVTVDTASDNGMFAYGGLRMGGEAFYGIDITNESSPEVMFTITPEGLNYTSSDHFERLGQIWSKPTEAKIRINESDDDPTDVLIFGGGYDMGYEDEEYVPTATDPAKGNAIYMINAQTGELIWSTSSAASAGENVKTDEMIHSITGEITVLDRDNDGLTDHIYAADLGGQVFRIDLQNARSDDFGFTAVSSFSAKPAVRILNTKPSDVSNSKYAYRFYDRPVVSFYRSEGGDNNGNLFALVNVVSGVVA